MIRHLVLLRFRADACREARDALMHDLATVVAAVPGCGGFRAFRNVSVEGPLTQGFEDGFELTFADADARAAYLDDPAHRAVGARIVAATEGGVAGVVVFDSEAA
jgi:hypothetical protein